MRARARRRSGSTWSAFRTELALRSSTTRQFPQAVRRSVLDGAAPPDMALARELLARQPGRPRCPCSPPVPPRPRAHATIRTCATAPSHRCSLSLPRTVKVAAPSHRSERGVRPRSPATCCSARSATQLYVPAIAAALPEAIDAAARGEFAGLVVGLNATFTRAQVEQARDPACISRSSVPRTCRACRRERRPAGRGFRQATSPASTSGCARAGRAATCRRRSTRCRREQGRRCWLLSGGLDPGDAAAPRRACRARARALWRATSSSPNAGHGVLGVGCVRDVVYRFIDDAPRPAMRSHVDTGCAANVPRPPAFRPVGSDAPGGPPSWVAR